VQQCNRKSHKTTREDDEEYSDLDNRLLDDGHVLAHRLVDPQFEKLESRHSINVKMQHDHIATECFARIAQVIYNVQKDGQDREREKSSVAR
jgi:hypothetical protein